MKGFLKETFSRLGIFLLLNVPVILVYILVSLFFKIPVVDELADRFANAKLLEGVLYALYAVVYFVILALLICKNSSARSAYLNATAGEKYSFKGELASYSRETLTVDIAACTVLAVAVFALLAVFNKNGILAVIFLPQYSLLRMMSTVGAAIFYAAFTPIFTGALTLISQKIWNKNRLGGNSPR